MANIANSYQIYPPRKRYYFGKYTFPDMATLFVNNSSIQTKNAVYEDNAIKNLRNHISFHNQLDVQSLLFFSCDRKFIFICLARILGHNTTILQLQKKRCAINLLYLRLSFPDAQKKNQYNLKIETKTKTKIIHNQNKNPNRNETCFGFGCFVFVLIL